MYLSTPGCFGTPYYTICKRINPTAIMFQRPIIFSSTIHNYNVSTSNFSCTYLSEIVVIFVESNWCYNKHFPNNVLV